MVRDTVAVETFARLAISRIFIVRCTNAATDLQVRFEVYVPESLDRQPKFVKS